MLKLASKGHLRLGKKQFRGMGFITMQPQGYYRGRRNTKQMMIDWVLEEEHVIRGVKVDVTEASKTSLSLFGVDV